MSHFTSKLALDKADETVHRRLVKYSKGEFEGPTIEINAKGKTLAINGSPEYEDLIGRIMMKHAPSEMEFRVSGATKCTQDQTDVLRNAGLDIQMSKAKGKDRYEAKLNDNLMPTKALRDIYSGLADECHILLTIKPASGGREWSMSTKKDYPRPSPKGEIKGSGVDFCKAILPLSDELAKDVLSEVLPDFEGEIKTPFRQLRVENHYKIDEVILPENRERISYTEIRLGAKKKGMLIRKATVDGRELAKERQFCI